MKLFKHEHRRFYLLKILMRASGGARALKLGGGQSRAEGARYLGGSGGMLPRENFEIGNP